MTVEDAKPTKFFIDRKQKSLRQCGSFMDPKKVSIWKTFTNIIAIHETHSEEVENSNGIEWLKWNILNRSNRYQKENISTWVCVWHVFLPITLSKMLNYTGCRYEAQGKHTSNLIYIDDLKMNSKNDREQEKFISTLQTLTDNVRVQFGLNNYAKASFHQKSWPKLQIF